MLAQQSLQPAQQATATPYVQTLNGVSQNMQSAGLKVDMQDLAPPPRRTRKPKGSHCSACRGLSAA